MSSFSKNLEKFLTFFFTAISLVLIVLGVSRINKTTLSTEAPTPEPSTPVDTTGATTFTGAPSQTPWGTAVAQITVKDGKVIAVKMPSVPNSPPSIYAEAYLVDQALKTGSANIQGVSGATYTSIAFKTSLESAILKAQTEGQSITPNKVSSATTYAKPSVPRKYREDDDDEDEEHEFEWEF